MTDRQTYLAVTDYSTPARHAADRAARLAEEAGADLRLMHVQPVNALNELRQWLGVGTAAERQIEASGLRELQRLADELAASRHISIRAVQSSGSVCEEIDREANASNAQLIVLGSRGAGLLRRIALGTTADRLLRRTRRPMLLVHQPAHVPYRRALVAVDFSPWSFHAIAAARRHAPLADLILLHAFEVPFEDKLHYSGVDDAVVDRYRLHARTRALQHIRDLASAAGLQDGQWIPRIIEGEPAQRIVEQAEEHDCDLIILGKHGQSAAEDLLLGSVTERVLAESTIDVLVSTTRHTQGI